MLGFRDIPQGEYLSFREVSQGQEKGGVTGTEARCCDCSTRAKPGFWRQGLTRTDVWGSSEGEDSSQSDI